MTKARQWLLGVPAALLVGALGSGLWDVGIKPGFQWLGRALLTAVSFGSNTFRDSIYIDAAKGLHEAAGTSLLSILSGVMFGLPFVAGSVAYFMKRDAARLKKVSDARSESGELQVEISHEADLATLFKRFDRLFRIYYLLLLILLVLVGAHLIISVETIAATDACVYFTQSLAICRPYIPQHDADILQSHFAAMRSRSDYMNLIQQLRGVAAANHLVLPQYEPW
jgi:hypothetical protein